VSGLWANVEANPRAPDSQLTEGDKWANRGGKTSGSFQSNADVYKEVNTHHEQFVKMMKSIRAQEMICATDPKSPCN
jgi:hypothetical protein